MCALIVDPFPVVEAGAVGLGVGFGSICEQNDRAALRDERPVLLAVVRANRHAKDRK